MMSVVLITIPRWAVARSGGLTGSRPHAALQAAEAGLGLPTGINGAMNGGGSRALRRRRLAACGNRMETLSEGWIQDGEGRKSCGQWFGKEIVDMIKLR